MEKPVVVKGRLIGPKSVELDEPVTGAIAEVEVLIHPAKIGADQSEAVSHFLRGLPPGTRSKEEINQQLHTERASWGNR